MFRKLVSNLPFSPSLVGRISFYAGRLKKEQFTRKLGLIFTVILVVVQSVTVFVPAQPTIAASTNDIVFGGGKKEALLQAYQSGCDSKGRCDIKQIFNEYGIGEGNLAAATYETIHSSQANNYWSIGRSSRGYGGEVAKQIPNGPKLWSRTLHGWKANHNWDVLKVHTDRGVRWILTECGNIVTKESTPTQPTPKPDMTVTKTVSKPSVKKGEKFSYTIVAKNIGKGTANNVLIYDDAPAGIALQPDGLSDDPLISPSRWQTHKRFNIGEGQSFTYRIFAIATTNGPATLQNTACADFFDINVYNNCAKATVKVEAPAKPVEKCPYNAALSKNDPNCKAPVEKCPYNQALAISSPSCKPPTVKCPYNQAILATDPACKAPVEKCPYNSSLVKNDPNCKPPVEKCPYDANLSKNDPACKPPVEKCPYDATLPKDDPNCKAPVEKCPFDQRIAKTDTKCQFCPIEGKQNIALNSTECTPCDESKQTTEGKDISCLELHKTAKNVTRQIANASGTRANPGDTIEYTLSVKNFGKEVRKGFVIEENMEDVLEYADIIDASGATFTTNPVHLLSWGPIDIKPGETITRTILIKVKSTIPVTPASTSDPYSHDLKMVNVYGDTVEIKLPSHPIKTIEQTVTKLPSTGFEVNMLIGTFLVMATTYFYFRSRTMRKELLIIRQQFQTGGVIA